MEVDKSLDNEEAKTSGSQQGLRAKKTLIGANVIFMILIAIAILSSSVTLMIDTIIDVTLLQPEDIHYQPKQRRY